MEALALICFVWLIILQITVNRLEDQLKNLSSTQNKDLSPQKVKPTPAPLPQESAREEIPVVAEASHSTPVSEPVVPPVQTPAAPKPSKPAFEITAAKLFSWIGGFMLFLGCVWAIKYTVDNNLLSPAMRIIVSLGAGILLAAWGYGLKNEKYRVLSHTLLGSGLAIVYASIYCAHAFYQFISLSSAFILLAITSFATFGLSLKKEAKYVGYLGAVIAFLTPFLLSSGEDSWVIFFSYVFCINAATAYGAFKKGWNDLFICTLGFTWLCQAGWLSPFAGYKLVGIASFFSLYALASAWLIRKEQPSSVISHATGSFLCMGLLLMTAVAPAITHAVTDSLLFLTYVLIVNLLILLLAGRAHLSVNFARVGKCLSFLVLFIWLIVQAKTAPLWLTLGAALVFAALNSSVELWPALRQQPDQSPDLFSLLYPLAMMGGLLIAFILMGETVVVSFVGVFITLSIFLAGLLVLAVLAHLIWIGFIAAGLLFLFLIASLILGSGGVSFTPCVLLSGLIPMLLCGGVLFTLRRFRHTDQFVTGEKILSAGTALMPFFLILIVTQLQRSLSLHWILGISYAVCLLNVLTARLYKNTFTLPAAAIGAGLVQLAIWPAISLQTAPLFRSWVVAFFLLFIAVPFLSKEYFWKKDGTWIACALSGVSTFLFGCGLIHEYWSFVHTGWVPGVLFAIYLLLLYKLWTPQTLQTQPISIAFISGAMLFFLSIIFPLEIHNHWLVVCWAAEAVVLAYLHTRLPYPGWQIVSAGLALIVASGLLFPVDGMIQLIDLNKLPSLRIWNWYLWVYGLCAGAFFLLIKLWEKPSQWVHVFSALFGCMLFWLLNIEIAHWFHTAGPLEFNPIGKVAEALTYTLGWALFGITTISIGLRNKKSVVANVGIGIMSLALLKFFLSDIWQLEIIYRILGAFGLAILLITASFWYQKKQTIR